MARWSDVLLGSTDRQRFERYTLASLQMLLAIDCFVGISCILSFPVHLSMARMVTGGVVVIVAWLTSAALLGRAARTACGLPGLRRWHWRVLAVVAIVAQATALMLFPRTQQMWGNAGTLALAAGLAPVTVMGTALRGRSLHLLVVALVAPALLLAMPGGPGNRSLLLPAFYTVVMAYTGALSGWMLRVLHELDRARITSARLAVAEERLRFSRDLHDVVGRSLSAVALKSQLAAELARRGRSDQAVDEMLAVHRIADESLAEMRKVVAGIRTADLERELEGARVVLDSAGVAVTVRGDAPAAFDQSTREGLAWALREAVTNVVRHSDARRCTIALEAGSNSVLTVWNDGARHDDSPAGSGLVGLSERLNGIGGRLDVRRTGDEFTLQVTIANDPTTERGKA